MNAPQIQVTRTDTVLMPDQSRVLLRPFYPGPPERVAKIVERIMAVPEDQIEALLEGICDEFCQRHQHIKHQFRERFQQVARQARLVVAGISDRRRLLIGSYFLAENSLESAALFNPSIVPHPDQSGLPPRALRFILSLRATGEGHISSITFRTGVIHPDNRIEVMKPTGFLSEPRQTPSSFYERDLFLRKLAELGLSCGFADRVIHRLGELFALEELRASIEEEQSHQAEAMLQEDHNAAKGTWMLARSNFEVQFQPEQHLSERILFPATPSQRNGIEDARFVCFRDEDGAHTYYATFTAFDGRIVMPELVETPDFLHFRFLSLNGPAAENKGMALFPRKIRGRYAMISRQDNESV